MWGKQVCRTPAPAPAENRSSLACHACTCVLWRVRLGRRWHGLWPGVARFRRCCACMRRRGVVTAQRRAMEAVQGMVRGVVLGVVGAALGAHL